MLVDPRNAGTAKLMFEPMLMSTAGSFEDATVLRGLQQADMLVAEDRFFDALKQLRGLFPTEAAILASSGQAPEPSLAEPPPEAGIAAMPPAFASHAA